MRSQMEKSSKEETRRDQATMLYFKMETQPHALLLCLYKQRRQKGTVRTVGREWGLTGMTRKQRWHRQTNGVQKSSYKKHQDLNKLWGYASSKGVPYRSQVRDHGTGNVTHSCHRQSSLHSQMQLWGWLQQENSEAFIPPVLGASRSHAAYPLSRIETWIRIFLLLLPTKHHFSYVQHQYIPPHNLFLRNSLFEVWRHLNIHIVSTIVVPEVGYV